MGRRCANARPALEDMDTPMVTTGNINLDASINKKRFAVLNISKFAPIDITPSAAPVTRTNAEPLMLQFTRIKKSKKKKKFAHGNFAKLLVKKHIRDTNIFWSLFQGLLQFCNCIKKNLK